ncbi:MAG: hypothetical protein K2N70_05990, partial [Helicobacter sp.]|nr:hypothetical protein [Helicobacter sp.]
LAYVNSPQRCVYVMPYGSNIDVARCDWEGRIKSNSRFYFLSLRASNASVAINEQRIPKKNPNTFDCFGQYHRNDSRIFCVSTYLNQPPPSRFPIAYKSADVAKTPA